MKTTIWERIKSISVIFLCIATAIAFSACSSDDEVKIEAVFDDKVRANNQLPYIFPARKSAAL